MLGDGYRRRGEWYSTADRSAIELLDSMPRGIQRVGRLVTVIDTISINVGRSF